MDYSMQDRPTDNPFVESFNGSFRDECLNAHWFLSLVDAKEKIKACQVEHNEFRPHSSLDDPKPPKFFLATSTFGEGVMPSWKDIRDYHYPLH